MIKTLNKVDIEAMYLNIIKSIYDKPTLCDVGFYHQANIILSVKS